MRSVSSSFYDYKLRLSGSTACVGITIASLAAGCSISAILWVSENEVVRTAKRSYCAIQTCKPRGCADCVRPPCVPPGQHFPSFIYLACSMLAHVMQAFRG